MGHESQQSFRFPCKGCGEDIGVGLSADYVKFGCAIGPELNCTTIEEDQNGSIILLDGAFPIPDELQGQDRVFPRMEQMAYLLNKLEAEGRLPEPVSGDLGTGRSHVTHLEEWRDLRRAWTLHRRKQAPLSRGIIKTASAKIYAYAPLDSLEDWMFRFAQMIGGHLNSDRLDALADRVNAAAKQPGWKPFLKHYHEVLASKRGLNFLTILSQYFDAYSEFAQLQTRVVAGMPPKNDERVGSVDFDKTRMFYGNAFEMHAELLEVPALLNNVIHGRAFDAFERLTLDQFRSLDKARRGDAFAADPVLHALAEEANNRIRNASHHANMRFDPESQIITFRPGKGAGGDEIALTYANYLAACVRMMMQVLLLLQLELVMSDKAGTRSPL